MARIVAVGRRGAAGAVVGQFFLVRDGGEALTVRRIFDDAEHRTALRRRQAMAARDGVAIAAIVGGRARRLPQFVHDGAAFAAAEDVRGRAIDEESRTAIDIMTGDDATNGFCHFVLV